MTNLSNRSINLLKNDNVTWYKGYVLGQRESEFQTYFVIGAIFAEIIEQYHKKGEREIDRFVTKLKSQFMINNCTEDEREKAITQLHELVENAKLVVIDRTEHSEFESIISIDSDYSLKCKYDALWSEYVEDYKSVTSFSKEDEAMEKYAQQIKLYQWSEYKRTGNKIKGKITEIKKGRPTLPTKKEELIALLPEGVDNTGTVADIRARLYLYVNKDQISKEFWFERNDSILEYVPNLLRKSIIKANYLKSLQSLDDVL